MSAGGPGASETRPQPVVNKPSRGRPTADRLAELWQYRHLVGNLVVRDLKVRYKNSWLGFLWSMASPLMMMAVFWLIFGKLWPNPTQDFHVFILIGVLAWNWFGVSVAGGLRSIVANASLINKVYFPREVLPLSVVLSELANFALAVPVLLAVIALSGLPITAYALWLPVIVAVQMVFTLGVVLILATANVYYRDVAMIMEPVLLAWFFLTPIFYDYEQFQGNLTVLGSEVPYSRLAYYANPLGTLVANYRTVLYGSVDHTLAYVGPPGPPDALFLVRTLATAVLVLAIGYWVFGRYSGRFGEEV